ncbi:MAG: efflux transporter periplasmic adaptor subunit, partial [Rhodoferax sp.]
MTFKPNAIVFAAVCAGAICAAGFFSINSEAADKAVVAPKPALTVTAVLPQAGTLPLQISA